MATFIDGIGASENIDSSGEVVSIAGLDISSLDKDGVFNYEHKSDLPAQVVGKVLKAKKIFSDVDCEDDRQKYFWNKCKTPFLYVMGELFDDYSDSAREVAGKFRYDADHKNTNERNVMNFSVEGSKISKEGITVTRSIARKITITVLACNKMAVAEMVAVPAGNPKKAQVDELFKTEAVEIETFTPTPGSKIWDLLKKEDPKKYADKLGLPLKKDFQSGGGGSQELGGQAGGYSGPNSAGGLALSSSEKVTKPMNKALPTKKDHQRGSQIGLTSSGKPVFSHGMVGDYHGFSAKDHSEAAGHHKTMASKLASTDNKAGTHHYQKYTLHSQASKSANRKAKSAKPGNAAASTSAPTSSKPSQGSESGGVGKYAMSPNPKIKKNAATDQMNKALSAGSGLTSPASLSQGEALASENIGDSRKKKSKLLQRAELEYTTWTKREEFEAFMKSRMPKLTRAEIQVIGQTMLLQKSLKQEKLLKDFYNPSVLKNESLEKTLVHQGVHEFEGQKHHVQVNKMRSGRYVSHVSPGEKPITAPGSIHTVNHTAGKQGGFKVSHEVPYAHPGHTNSPTAKAVRSFVTQKVKEHHEKK